MDEVQRKRSTSQYSTPSPKPYRHDYSKTRFAILKTEFSTKTGLYNYRRTAIVKLGKKQGTLYISIFLPLF
jgi:CMP-2-keto-3-deoxyoctulosonic acid synthetase